MQSNAPIHDLLHCDARYSVYDIIKNMYTQAGATWSISIYSWPPTTILCINFLMMKKKNLHQLPFCEKNWVFDQMQRQFEEQMVDLLTDPEDFNAEPKKVANGMFIQTTRL